MSDVLSFPGLGIELNINPVLATIGSLTIRWYGLIFAAAFAVAVGYTLWRAKDFGLNSDRMLDVILGAFIAGMVGARLYYVVFAWDMYKDNPISALYIWEGGIAIYGGVIGAFLVGAFLCKLRGVKLLPMFDLGATALLLAQAIGRWGNFFNMEAFGGNTDLPWGMTSNTIVRYLTQQMDALAAQGIGIIPSAPVHPTFLYESLWNLLGFALLAFVLTPRRRFDGQLFLTYLIWYGAGRFLIEGLRTDSLMAGSVRASQVVAVVCVAVAAYMMLRTFQAIKKANDPEYLKLYVLTEEGAAAVSGALYAPKTEAAPADEAGEASDAAEEAEETAQQPEDAAEEVEAAAEQPEEEAAPETVGQVEETAPEATETEAQPEDREEQQ